MGFDPSRKPRPPQGVENQLKERQDYFDPKLVEGGFTVEEAEGLGWAVDFFHASKPFPGLGLVEVHSKDSDQGRYGVLQAVYDFELGQHQRAQSRARELYLRLVRVERSQLQALNAAKAAREEAPSFDLGSESDPKHPDLSDEEWAALNAAHERESQARQRALEHTRKMLQLSADLDAFSLLELPEEYIEYLKDSKPLDVARR